VDSVTTKEIESAIIADVGSVSTTVGLVDVVNGRHRLLARGCSPTTIAPPYADVAIGILEALGQIEHLTGRKLLSATHQLISPEQSDGQGVDTAASTSSAGLPLRLAITGFASDFSLASARNVAATIYTDVVATLPVEQESANRSPNGLIEAWVDQLSRVRPEVILMTGGINGGPVEPLIEMAEVIALSSSALPEPARPNVIFAGNETARQAVADILSSELTFQVVDNVRPTWDSEQLNQATEALAQIYRLRRIARLPGMGTVRSWTTAQPLSTAEAFSWAINFLSRQENTSVLGLDLGSKSLCIAGNVAGAELRYVDMHNGLRYSLNNVVERVGLQQVVRWLPMAIPENELANQLANIALHPLAQPQTMEQFWIEQAAIREALHLAVTEAARLVKPQEGRHPGIMVDYLLISGNRLTNMPKPAHLALAVLDGMQPIGITHLLTDRFKLVGPVTSLSQVAPVAAAHLLINDVLASVGTMVAPAGRIRAGKTALRCDLSYADGSTFRLDVPSGAMEIVPLSRDQEVLLDLRPSRGLDLGPGPGKRVKTKVKGGSLGIIIDARGRPLMLPEDDETRRTRLKEWQQNVGA